MRTHIGHVYRGIRGWIGTLFEHIPSVPQEIETEGIGHSVEGREIECFNIGNGPRHVAIVSAIHGNEVGTVKLSRHILHWLWQNKDKVSNLTCHVVPVLNPDGYEKAKKNPQYLSGGNIGRFNAHAVDLNRNFNTPSFTEESVWAYGKEYAHTRKVFCGTGPASEPEIQALVRLIKKYDISTLLIFHNAGRDVMGNNNPLSQKEAAVFSRKTGFKLLPVDDWKRLGQTGTAAEWCDIHKLAYIEVEGSTRWSSDWSIQQEGICTVLADLHNA